jgi:methylenetetrahydrofolate dehydrogenase (NADP+)/methenyltetrahydrofolate cyclohydrolase
MKHIDCKKYAQELLDEVKAVPDKKKLVILTAGDNPASLSYVKGKIKDCEYCSVPYEHIKVRSQEELLNTIAYCNSLDCVGGIIVQLPLPDGFNEQEAVNAVRIDKDVDGFKHGSPFLPCTPEGIMYLLKREIGDLTGKRALVIGRGKLVGKPVAQMLLNEDCTVTVAHSKTENLWKYLREADIVIAAAGRAGLVNLDYCWHAEVVIDAGVNRRENGKLCGDCYGFDPEEDDFLRVTPVPGGIGLMTRAMLMKHMV